MLGSPRAPARAKQLSRMPGTKTTWKTLEEQIAIWKQGVDLQRLTEQARAFHGLRAGGPAITSRACANVSLSPRAEGAARPYSHASTRDSRRAPSFAPPTTHQARYPPPTLDSTGAPHLY